MRDQTFAEAAKGTPAVVGTIYSAVTLNETVAALTCIYILLQIAYLTWKWRKEAKSGKSDS